MLLSIFTQGSLRRAVFLLVPVLLFAQGLQLCQHAHDDMSHASDHAHISAVHLESALTAAGNHGESVSDVDVGIAALLKLFYSQLVFAIAPVLMFFVAGGNGRISRLWPPDFHPNPRNTYHLIPPLRAPPL